MVNTRVGDHFKDYGKELYASFGDEQKTNKKVLEPKQETANRAYEWLKGEKTKLDGKVSKLASATSKMDSYRILDGDSALTRIAKIAKAIFTLGIGPLYASYSDQKRPEKLKKYRDDLAFVNGHLKKVTKVRDFFNDRISDLNRDIDLATTFEFSAKKEEILTKCAFDCFRNPYLYQGQVIRDRAWIELQDLPNLTPKEIALLEQYDSYEVAKESHLESEQKVFEELVKKLQVHLKDKIMPQIFDEMAMRHGDLEALRILNYFNQALPNYMAEKINKKSGKRLLAQLPEGENPVLMLDHHRGNAYIVFKTRFNIIDTKPSFHEEAPANLSETSLAIIDFAAKEASFITR